MRQPQLKDLQTLALLIIQNIKSMINSQETKKRSHEQMLASSGDTGFKEEVEKKAIKLKEQKKGDYLVDANKAINIHFLSNDSAKADSLQNLTSFDAAEVDLFFGDDQVIKGYEKLKIDFYFSKNTLRPLLKSEYFKKVPNEALADNFTAKFEEHFQNIWTSPEKFQEEVLKEDANFEPLGELLKEIQDEKLGGIELYKMTVQGEKEERLSQQLQGILPLFIEGASRIQAYPYWKYFLLYKRFSKHEVQLLGFTTVFQAYHSADKYRSKISQVFIVPTFQRKGLGHLLYQEIYEHYLSDQKCFQLIVEDANDNFQIVQDIVNANKLFQACQPLQAIIKSLNGGKMRNKEIVKESQISQVDLRAYSEKLKLPKPVLRRINEAITFSFMALEAQEAEEEFRLAFKRRMYKQVMKTQTSEQCGGKSTISNLLTESSGIAQPYIFLASEQPPYPMITEIDKMMMDRAVQTGLKIQFKNQLNKCYEHVLFEYLNLAQKLNAALAK